MAEEAAAAKARGNAHLKEGRFAEAVAEYTEAIRLDDSKHVYFSNRSAAYLSMGAADKALVDAEACIKLSPEWAKGYGRKGAALHALHRYEDALAAYDAGLAIAPDNAPLQSGRADAAAAAEAATARTAGAGPSAEAAAGLGALFSPENLARLAGNPKTAPLLEDASFMAMLGQVAKNPQLLQVLGSDPRMKDVLGVLLGGMGGMGGGAAAPPSEEERAAAAARAKAAAEARAAAEAEAAAAAAAEAEAAARAAETPEEKAAREAAEAEAAAEAERKAAEAAADAEAAEAAKLLKDEGNALYKAREFDAALAKYEEAWLAFPKDITPLNNRATVFYQMKDYDAAIEASQRAIEEGRPIYADFRLVSKAYNRIAAAWKQKGDLREAIAAYESSLMESGDDAVRRMLRKAKRKLQKQEAEAYLDPALAEEAKARGNALFSEGKFADAIKEYDEAIRRDPNNAKYWANRGACYSKLARFDTALPDIEKAIELDASYTKAYLRRAAIYHFQKEFHKAMADYERALALEPESTEAMEGLARVQTAIRSTSGTVDKERAARALADPEIREIWNDAYMQNVLRDMSENPASAAEYLKDAGIAAKLQKLMEAGLIGMR